MDIEELHAVQSRERSSSDLQELRDSFYADVGEYIEELRDERDRLATECDDPYDDAVIRVNDKIQTAERVVESIYERRVGKVVDRAAFTATGLGEAELDGLTTEERELFEAIVERIEGNKDRVLEDVARNGEESDRDTEVSDRPDQSTEEDSTDEDTGVDAADVLAGGMTDGGPVPETVATKSEATPPATSLDTGDDATSTEESTNPTESDSSTSGDPSRKLIRITEDVGEILGVDERIYDLQSNDIVTLPAPNAAPLLERGAAEQLN